MENYIQKREEALKGKVYAQTKREDFEEFWTKAVAQLRAVPIQIKRKKLETPFDKTFTTYELDYNTHDDTWVKAYFCCPKNAEGRLPCAVHFHGGSLSKIIPHEVMNTGICCLSIDVRGQGGETIDRAVYKTGCFNNALMTMGVLDKEEFYLKNIFLDAVRAVDVVAELDEVDPERIVTWGGSQGGALSIAASALSGRSKKCYTSETSYCCIHRRIELGSRIFGGTHNYLRKYPENTDKVMETVSYFDVNNMVSLLKVPTSFNLGLADDVCLPEFVYSAYTHAECEKTLHIIPFLPHQGSKIYYDFVYREFAAL